MLFNSVQFVIFFPISTLIYFVVPRKYRYIWLLIASYVFYMGWNVKYVFLLLFITLVTYLSGVALEYCASITSYNKRAYKNAIVAISVVISLGVLFYFKYTGFAISVLTEILSRIHIYIDTPRFDVILPVGISFFTFQALSYTIDVYREEIHAEKNLLRYALYVSFFPQLVAGPIERAKNLLKQLAVPTAFDFEKARDGFLLMIWGYFLKLVIADRIAVIVDTVYNGYDDYSGWYFIVATLLFAVQIYCDFAGYSTIAIGASEILGISIMDNFDAPYMAQTVKDFWRRWHISLTSWFRDYLYIPLGGGKKGRLRKYFNILVVFLTSGLWHGAAFHFVVWGGINGVFQIVGEFLQPFRNKMIDILKLNSSSFGFRLYKTIFTFALVDISWVYFRANRFYEANRIILSMIRADNPWVLFDGSLYQLGLDEKNFIVMLVGIIILFVADFLRCQGICVRKKIAEQDYPFRWIVVSMSIVAILIFGVWGGNYNEKSFIYFQF